MSASFEISNQKGRYILIFQTTEELTRTQTQLNRALALLLTSLPTLQRMERMIIPELDHLAQQLNELMSTVLEQKKQREQEQATCAICMENKKEIIFVPCGHQTACLQCAEQLSTCPMCCCTITHRVSMFDP